MQKITTFVVFLLTVVGETLCANETSGWSDIEQLGFFQASLLHTLDVPVRGCYEKKDVLKAEYEKAVQCVKDVKSTTSFCQTFVFHFEPCVQKLLDLYEGCDVSSERGIRAALVNSLVGEAKFLCQTDGEHIFEFVNPCVFKTFENSKTCIKNVTSVTFITHMNPQPGESILEPVCQMVSGIKDCFSPEFSKECHNEITKDSFHKLYSVEAKPCNVVIAYISQLFMFF
ncbi:hypothetical protein HHI36_008636 [Cryptolaemus montrouzieri]|uniref:DUF19 domain-containing protein n=1 Tax=Cryptolaemus montrouzieri TaxID=559131 RepID=A0ABD2MT54_9CUCU